MNISIEDFKELKRLYAECVEETFIFKGEELLKSYAKYLIEYLEGKFES